MNHVIRSQQFNRKILSHIFKRADELSVSHTDTLQGHIMASLFYEPSTRTRFSFESAMHRLVGSVIATENASLFSSAAKGETLEDTVRVTQQYADVIVLRHPEKGASRRAAAVAGVPIINAGDGTGQHPTQALLDLYTIEKECGRIDGVHVVCVGDLKHGRTVRSLAYLLGKYEDVHITFVSPRELRIGSDIRAYLDRHKVFWSEEERLDTVLAGADVVYQTRIQKERFKSEEAYLRNKGAYVLTMREIQQMKEEGVLLHPLPRVDEIAEEVDTSPKAAYFRQVKYGVLVRMALLELVLRRTL